MTRQCLDVSRRPGGIGIRANDTNRLYWLSPVSGQSRTALPRLPCLSGAAEGSQARLSEGCPSKTDVTVPFMARMRLFLEILITGISTSFGGVVNAEDG
jgi:hypothetical protein